MKTRILHTKIWEDEWYYSLSLKGQHLFVYLLTNLRINMCGMYQIPDRIILGDLRHYSKTDLARCKQELSPKVRFHNGWVYIPNALKYNGYKGSKNAVALKKEVEALPVDIKKILNPSNNG